MKTAISIPDELFGEAERLGKALGKSRSELYRNAIESYIGSHDPDLIREALDRVLADVGETDDVLPRAAATRILRDTEW